MPTLLAPKRKALNATVASIDIDAPFTYRLLTVDEVVLESIDAAVLSKYCESFKKAHITDAALAATMTVDDMRSLLKAAPLGHILRLRQLLQQNCTPRPKISSKSSWIFPSTVIGKGASDGTLQENILKANELVMVSSSLLFGSGVAILTTLPDECADGTDCPRLRFLDFLLWTVSCSLVSLRVHPTPEPDQSYNTRLASLAQ